MAIKEDSKRFCELCYMNPPVNTTEDGGVTFLPVPEALPGDDLCADCRQQSDGWARNMKRHQEENHQAPWEHDCQMCSLDAYTEEQEKNWQAHLARCEECQKSSHDFVTAPPRCRACGAEANEVAPNDVCLDNHTREMHRDMC